MECRETGDMLCAMSVKALIPCLFFAGVQVLAAQDSNHWYGTNRSLSGAMLSGSLDVGVARSHFTRNMDKQLAGGMAFELLLNLQKRKPVWAGVGFQRFLWDINRLSYTQQIDNDFYNYEERTASRIIMLHGVIRFQPQVRWVLQPYVQGAAGLHWYYTNTKIVDVDYDEVVEKITESREVIPGFALHAGMQFVPRKLPDVRIDARLGYLNNASVEYLRYNPNLPVGNYPIDSFEAKNSPVEILDIQIGVTIVIRSASDEDKE